MALYVVVIVFLCFPMYFPIAISAHLQHRSLVGCEIFSMLDNMNHTILGICIEIGLGQLVLFNDLAVVGSINSVLGRWLCFTVVALFQAHFGVFLRETGAKLTDTTLIWAAALLGIYRGITSSIFQILGICSVVFIYI